MLNVRLCLCTVLFLIVFSPAAAQALEQRMHMFEISPAVEYYTFKSDDGKETGPLYGMTANYNYHGKFINDNFSSAMFKVEGRILVGRPDFAGQQLIQLNNNTHYNIKNLKEFLGEVRGLAGYDFAVFSDTTLTPFAGLGYRYLSDNLSKNDAGYRRKSNYIYSPIGVQTLTPLRDGWTMGLNAEYDIFWHGWQNIELSDLDPLFSDLTTDQRHGFGVRGSFKIRKESSDKNFVLEPYASYWNIEDSDVKKVYHTGVYGGTNYREKQNTSTEIGLRIGVEF